MYPVHSSTGPLSAHPQDAEGVTAEVDAELGSGMGIPEQASSADTGDHPVTDTVRGLLDEVDEIRRAAGDEFDLVALARQTQLLERAHDALSEALGSVDHRGA